MFGFNFYEKFHRRKAIEWRQVDIFNHVAATAFTKAVHANVVFSLFSNTLSVYDDESRMFFQYDCQAFVGQYVLG